MSPCQINKNVKIILTLLIFSIDKTSALRDLNFTIISLLSSQYSHQNIHSLIGVLDLYYLHEKACLSFDEKFLILSLHITLVPQSHELKDCYVDYTVHSHYIWKQVTFKFHWNVTFLVLLFRFRYYYVHKFKKDFL